MRPVNSSTSTTSPELQALQSKPQLDAADWRSILEGTAARGMLADPEVRRDHIRELFRVADKWTVFSYFDRASMKNRIRVARTALGLSRKNPKNTLGRREVRAMAAEAGFEVLEDPMLFRISSGHRLVLARRVGG